MWIPIRIEQIVIGAAVNGTGLPPETRFLRPQDFDYTTGAAAFQAIAAARSANPHADAVDVAELCAPALAEHFVSGQALLAYAAMAAQTPAKEIGHAVGVLLRQGSNLELDAARQQITDWAEDRELPAARLPQLAQATEALRQATHRRAELLEILPLDLDEDISEIWDVWSDKWDAPMAPDEPDAAWLDAEKTVLAGLIQHPRLLWTIGPWLHYATFWSPGFQDAFENMLILGADFARQDPMQSLAEGIMRYKDRTGYERSGPAGGRVSPETRQQEIEELRTVAATPTSPMRCVRAAQHFLMHDLNQRAQQATRQPAPTVFTEPGPALTVPTQPSPRL